MENFQKKNDPFILWAVSGIAAVLIRNSYSFFTKEIGFADFYIWNVGASLLVDTQYLQTISGTIVGFLVDIVVGATFGVITGLLLEWRGNKYYIIKGQGVGLMAWMFFYGLLYHNLPFTKANAPSDPLSNISAFIGHSIFGIMAAVIYVKWLSKKVTVDANENVTNSNQEPKQKKPRLLAKKYVLSPVPAKKPIEHLEKQGKIGIKFYTPISLKDFLSRKIKKEFKKPRKV